MFYGSFRHVEKSLFISLLQITAVSFLFVIYVLLLIQQLMALLESMFIAEK